MTYSFKLHPGVKFHDGTDLTSADVKASYDRLRTPPQGVVSTRQATFADIGTIETPDPLTVIFKMKAVNASMLEHFASPWNVIYSAKDLAADPNGPKTKINGTGPFIFVEHVKGSNVSGKRNEDPAPHASERPRADHRQHDADHRRAILVEAALSFLGFGIQPPNPALGSLIAAGQGEGFDLWWLVTFPGLTIVVIALAINFVGDGLRDALDPTQRRVRA